MDSKNNFKFQKYVFSVKNAFQAFYKAKTHFLKLKMLKIQILENEFVMVLKVTQQYNYRLSTEKKALKNLVSKK